MHEFDEMIQVIIEAYIHNEITFEEKEILLESLKDNAIEKGKAGLNWATDKLEKGTRAGGKAIGKAVGNVTSSDAVKTITDSTFVRGVKKGTKAVAGAVAASTAAKVTVDGVKKLAKSQAAKDAITFSKFAISTPAFALSIVSGALGGIAAGVDVSIRAMTDQDLKVFDQWSEKMTKWAGKIKAAVFAGLKAPAAGPIDWIITAAVAVQVSNFAFDHDDAIKGMIKESIKEIRRQLKAFEEEFINGMSEADAEKRLHKLERTMMAIEEAGTKLAAYVDGTKFIKSNMNPNTSEKKKKRRKEANKKAKKDMKQAMRREFATIRESMAFDKLDATIFEGSEISSYGYKVLQTMCTTLESTDDFDVEYIVESYLDID